jgi:hypothetical protein
MNHYPAGVGDKRLKHSRLLRVSRRARCLLIAGHGGITLRLTGLQTPVYLDNQPD